MTPLRTTIVIFSRTVSRSIGTMLTLVMAVGRCCPVTGAATAIASATPGTALRPQEPMRLRMLNVKNLRILALRRVEGRLVLVPNASIMLQMVTPVGSLLFPWTGS